MRSREEIERESTDDVLRAKGDSQSLFVLLSYQFELLLDIRELLMKETMTEDDFECRIAALKASMNKGKE